MVTSTKLKHHKFQHTENMIRGHHGILYEILPKNDSSKYALLEGFYIDTKIRPKKAIIQPLIELKTTGRLHLKRAMRSDGATGFPDLLSLFRGFFVHDALFSLIVRGLIDQRHIKEANDLMQRINREDGTNFLVAKTIRIGLRLFSKKHVQRMIEKEDRYQERKKGNVPFKVGSGSVTVGATPETQIK
jgi:hypothetical protein